MAVRQYIGARYVPTYYQNSLDPTSSEWEANVNYDPLTIVSLPNMHSYQSKKFVPSTIGSPASNPEYWYDQGYASAYYQALQDQIDDMKDGTVPGSLQEQIDTNTSDITALKNPKKFYIFLGDSWAEPIQWSFPVWPELLIQYFGLSSNDYLMLDDDGGGFADQGSNDYFIDCIINNPVTGHEVTDIIVAAGVNDRTHSISDIKSAIATFISTCKSMYPKATVYIACVGWAKSDTNTIAINTNSYVAFKEATIENGGVWLEDPYYTLLYNSDFADTLHPNQSGQEKVAKALYAAITCGAYSQHEKKSINISGYSPFAVDNTTALEVRHNHDTVTALINQNPPMLSMTISGGANMTVAWRQIASLDEPLYFGDYIQFNCIAEVTSTNINGPVECSVRLETGGLIYVRPAQAITACTHISFPLDFTSSIRN